ncbi:MAG: sigma-54 interaction domain-containing protein [Desulfohalobiaceae bacterium]
MQGSNPKILGNSPALKHVLHIVQKVAATESTVLVTGESGTGKELVVRALHQQSPRSNKPFVPINCGAIPADLLESELFGHEKGAFTHAYRSRAGRFELANGGTVFLDEIGELDIALQVKLLRAIQEKEFERVGSNQPQKTDIRIVAATNVDLEQKVQQGTFRKDLYYRLNVVPVHLPSLRERQEDILLLAEHFLHKFCKEKPLKLDPQTKDILLRYSWPGNVRELENFMERLSILCEGQVVQPQDLPRKILREMDPDAVHTPTQTYSIRNSSFSWPGLKDLHTQSTGLKEFMDEIEHRMLQEALQETEGIKNKAAELLGIKRTTLIEKLKKRNQD